MSDLTVMRDHCRRKAEDCARNTVHLERELAAIAEVYGPLAGRKELLRWHAKAAKDYGLWCQLANEIDAYLTGDEQPELTTDDDAPLWEMP